MNIDNHMKETRQKLWAGLAVCAVCVFSLSSRTFADPKRAKKGVRKRVSGLAFCLKLGNQATYRANREASKRQDLIII
jgi:hypothetical protein